LAASASSLSRRRAASTTVTPSLDKQPGSRIADATRCTGDYSCTAAQILHLPPGKLLLRRGEKDECIRPGSSARWPSAACRGCACQ
jgi:hypothetical protein